MKITPQFTLSLVTLGLAASVGAAGPDLSKLPPPAAKTGLTYAKDIRPLFEASCFGCHGEKKQKGELRLDSLEATLKGGENGKAIVVGKSKDSPLVISISQLDDETAMPPKRKGPPGGAGGPGGPPPEGARPNRRDGAKPAGPGGPGGPGGRGPKPLTADQVGLVRAWIDQGAK